MKSQRSSYIDPPASAEVPHTSLDSIIERGAQAVTNGGVLKVRRSEAGRTPAIRVPESYLIEDKLVSARLVMLGTIHRDKEGAALLSRWLDYLRPDVITLEFSRYGMMFRKKHGAALRAQLDALVAKMAAEAEPPCRNAVGALYDYIDLPYEYTRTSQYADRSGVPLHLLDLDLFSCANLRNVDELMDEKNLRIWFGGHGDEKNEIAKQRALARLFFDKGIRAFPYTNEMLTRDRHVKKKLELLTSRYQGKRILHVCGWQHLSHQHNIYDSLNPVKVFVHDRSVRV